MRTVIPTAVRSALKPQPADPHPRGCDRASGPRVQPEVPQVGIDTDIVVAARPHAVRRESDIGIHAKQPRVLHAREVLIEVVPLGFREWVCPRIARELLRRRGEVRESVPRTATERNDLEDVTVAVVPAAGEEGLRSIARMAAEPIGGLP